MILTPMNPYELTELRRTLPRTRQHIYVSRTIQARMRTIRPLMKQAVRDHTGQFGKFCAICDYDSTAITNYQNLTEYPPLNRYLQIAKFFEWVLSHDVNYSFAIVKYLPSEINRRLQRIYPGYNTLEEVYEALRSHIGSTAEYIARDVNYTRGCSCYGYSKLMLHLMQCERESGYPDALDFED